MLGLKYGNGASGQTIRSAVFIFLVNVINLVSIVSTYSASNLRFVSSDGWTIPTDIVFDCKSLALWTSGNVSKRQKVKIIGTLRLSFILIAVVTI